MRAKKIRKTNCLLGIFGFNAGWVPIVSNMFVPRQAAVTVAIIKPNQLKYGLQ